MGHYSKQELRVSSIDALATMLEKEDTTNYAKAAILAGHYYLDYDRTTRALVPAIVGITDDPELTLRFYTIAGTFPARSFGDGVGIRQALVTRGMDAKLVLLANDHVFQNKNFQRHDALIEIEGRSKQLRAGYFKGSAPIPPPYIRTVQAMGWLPDEVFYLWEQPNRNPDSPLPNKTYVLSEQLLDKTFKRQTAKKYKKEGIFIEHLENGEKSLNFCSKSSGANFCVLSGRTSGCFGVAFELLKTLIEGGNNIVVLFLPPDCIEPCVEAAEVLTSIHTGDIQIVIVTEGKPDPTFWNIVLIESNE